MILSSMAHDWTPIRATAEPRTRSQVIEQVRLALLDDRYQFRTAEGIAQELGTDVELIQKVLEESPELARQSALRDHSGRRVYTAASRRRTPREHLALIRWILTR
jgi:hypothetical protein